MWKTRVAFALCVILGQFANAQENESPASLKIVTHNVWYGFTKKSEPRYSNWKRWMASQAPDVVSLQELNEYTSDKLSEDAKFWGHQYSALLKEDGFATGITSRYRSTLRGRGIEQAQSPA